VFVNNYQRLEYLPPKKDVQFAIHLPGSLVTFPQKAVTVPADSCFIWPFHLDLGEGVELAWATAQPLTAVNSGNTRTVFLAETAGVPVELAFQLNGAMLGKYRGQVAGDGGVNILDGVKPGTDVAATFAGNDGKELRIVVLDAKSSLALWKGGMQGQERVFLTKAGLVLDGGNVRLTSSSLGDLSVGIYPALASLASGGREVAGKEDGVFERYAPRVPEAVRLTASFEKVQEAGTPRDIPMGAIQQPVATAPLDADFEKAAVWRIKLPNDIDLSTDPILRLHYVGDVARVMLNGKFITDDFYNGNAFEIGLRRHAPEILQGDLRIAVLPLRKDAPIFMAQGARPDFGEVAAVASLQSVEIVPRYQVQLTGK
jgi:hypothetical protein